MHKVLVANRGEVAIRIMRACAELGAESVGVFSTDDEYALHTRKADEAWPLEAAGPSAYLAMERLVAVAVETGCQAVHPGYGFLSEDPAFADRCADSGLVFVGPTAKTLRLLGDKTAARSIAERLGVPVLEGTPPDISIAEAEAFLAALGPGRAMVLKAVAGGGGRGQRVVDNPAALVEAYERCRSEAVSFGGGSLFAEAYLANARHVEVQIIGDGSDQVSHLWDRDCSIQRRHQKLVEIAPAPGLPDSVRTRLLDDAVAMARDVSFRSLGTFEFLVDATPGAEQHFFLEANPRLQVEHTVTEEVLGLDLVQLQLQLALSSCRLTDIGLDQASVPEPSGTSIEMRVNLETMSPDGLPVPTSGTIETFEMASGPGYRTDTSAYAGYAVNSRFDSLLAKVIVHSRTPGMTAALIKARRALSELRVEGVSTNAPFVQSIVEHPALESYAISTRFVDDHLPELLRATTERRRLFFQTGELSQPVDSTEVHLPESAAMDVDEGVVLVTSSMPGAVLALDVEEGDTVTAGESVLILEAMKMEHVVSSPATGRVQRICVSPGDLIDVRTILVLVELSDADTAPSHVADVLDPTAIPQALAPILDRRARIFDDARPEAVERRRRTSARMARENIGDLCDEDSFVEYGGLVVTPGTGLSIDAAAQRYPADGLVCGFGAVNGTHFEAGRTQTAVLAYDNTVMAGTQGPLANAKTYRLLEHARESKLPVVIFAEGGGGRAGTGGRRASGEESSQSSAPATVNMRGGMFVAMARLKGVVPTIGINSGRCFAGNAALLGLCDVIIATDDSTLGMGGPAMVTGAGLGDHEPHEIGPANRQSANGVIDVLVQDDVEAVTVARQYLSYFQGNLHDWSCADQRLLRHAIPENRLRAYDVRDIVSKLADTDSVLELRGHYAPGLFTALARIEGQSVGVVANNPAHSAGAIDSDAADKAARFLHLLESHGLPVVTLCDTPGIMVGPDAERAAIVRHATDLFVTGASLTVPTFLIITRKAYGLGAMAMGGGSLSQPFFTVAWPTAEFGGMAIEGQVRLGYRAELESIANPRERRARYDVLVAQAYENGRAIHQAETFGIDDVIDPMETRRWLRSGLASTSGPVPGHHVARRVEGW